MTSTLLQRFFHVECEWVNVQDKILLDASSNCGMPEMKMTLFVGLFSWGVDANGGVPSDPVLFTSRSQDQRRFLFVCSSCGYPYTR